MENGADDYIVKPFSPGEIIARINAILQRTKRSVFYTPELYTKDVLVFPGLIIDVNSHKVIVEDTEVLLTPKEFDLLLTFVRSPKRVFNREQLLKQLWEDPFYGDERTVDAHIKKLRQKIEVIGPQIIQTVWGVGYKYEDPGDH